MNMISLPPQLLPFNRKTKAWRKKVVDFADNKLFSNYSLIRKSVKHKKTNYNLLRGILDMQDVVALLNPEDLKHVFTPKLIQHYPLINTKILVLQGEELGRVFDYKVVITNPNAISEIEETKKNLILQELQLMVANTAQSQEEFDLQLQKMSHYFTYEWLDMREVRANYLLNHYVKELGMTNIFNSGFMDAIAVGEEIYQCDIVGGEPTLTKLNPCKIRVLRSGFSNRIEDADMIILEDYWSPGRVIDTFYDVLTKKDLDYLENYQYSDKGNTDSMGNYDDRVGIVPVEEALDAEGVHWGSMDELNGISHSLLPFDSEGNIRVLRVYWKSRRKIKKVKSYDPTTGEEEFTFYPETYVTNTDMGEEELIFYINEAWEGTKIGSDIYVNMRPRVIQYNRLSNPSRCHFGIIGSVYNLNEGKPFSLVDIMKPYNYLYDVVLDRLNRLLARNWGKIITMDLAKVPEKWTVEKWLYYIKSNNLAVVDSFKEGNAGVANGILAGSLNNASSGVIDAELGNSIQYYVNLLEYIKSEMSDVSGISKQREGLIANRETVGGVERATLQSSYITEWLYSVHEDVKKRVLECFLETAKIAMRGRNKKFQYILPDNSMKIMDIDGDEFAECDYGLVVDNSRGTQELQQKLDMLAQAALQNQALNFSTIMKLYSSSSMAEKQRMVEKNEQEMMLRQQETQQQQMQMQQQLMQMQNELKQAEMQQRDELNARDNETKILVAEINSQAEADRLALMNNDARFQFQAEVELNRIEEQARQFDAKLSLDKDRLKFDKSKAQKDAELKLKLINKQKNSSK